jgi:methylthioribulose-1-phosphate dehydratase
MIPPSPADLEATVRSLLEVGRAFAARGSVPATSGTFSHLDGPPPPGASAETALHLALYRDRPPVRAVIHTHADAAAVLSRAGRDVLLSGWELLKAFAGVTSHDASVPIPVFPNDQDVPALATRVSARLREVPAAPAYLLAGHGLYTWGSSLAEAMRHAVALEHLLACELDHRKLAALPDPRP